MRGLARKALKFAGIVLVVYLIFGYAVGWHREDVALSVTIHHLLGLLRSVAGNHGVRVH